MRWFIWMCAFAVLAACDIDTSDVDTDDVADPPDITGEYTVHPLTEVEGCEGVPEADTTWLEGDLTISGPPDDLLFAFGSGEELAGTVDAAFTWEVEGTVSGTSTTLEVVGEGLAFIGDQTWELDGDVALDVVDSTDGTSTCTLTGRMEAEQDPP